MEKKARKEFVDAIVASDIRDVNDISLLNKIFDEQSGISITNKGVHIGSLFIIPFSNKQLIESSIDVIRLSMFKRVRSNINGGDMLEQYEYDCDFYGADQVIYCKIVEHFIEVFGSERVLLHLLDMRRSIKNKECINKIIRQCYVF